MLNIFRYLKQFKGTLCIIMILLVIQAYGDLALPMYTSNIVDVGLSQSGVEEKVPNKIRESSLENIKLFLTDEEIKLVDDSFEKSDETILAKPSILGTQTIEMLSAYMQQMQQAGVTDTSEAFGGKEVTDLSTLSEDAKEEESIIYYLKDDVSKDDLEKLESCMEKPMMFYGMLNSAAVGKTKSSGEKEQMSLTAKEQEKMMQQVMEMFQPTTDNARRQELLSNLLSKYEAMWDTMAQSLVSKYIGDEYETVGTDMEQFQKNYLIKTGAKMIGVSFLVMLTMIIVGLLASKVSAKAAMNLRTKMFKNVIRFSNAELDHFSTASLITRSTNDIQQVQMVMVMMMRMVLYAPILGIGAVLKVVRTNTSMAWIIFVAVAAILVLVAFLFAVAMPKFKKMQTLVDRLNLVAREILTGLPVIRAFSREKHEEKRFEEANNDLMRTQLFTSRVMSGMMPMMTLIMYGITVMILWFGAKGIDFGDMQVGDMIAFITYTMQIVMSFLMLTMMSIMLPRAGVAAKRIDEVIDMVPSINDKPETVAIVEGVTGTVTFEDVDFSYPNAEDCVLEGINFTARPGETTAIIGSTGSGKSTLINLIPRFYDVTRGSIKIDGIDVRDIKQKDLRQLLGYVPQKGVLFSGTIESNIKFGNPKLADELMETAAEIAQAEDFIKEKPTQYESEIAQGGSNVSGGQKQRLSIARAIANQPKVFIFDDSFSALDFKTDAALRRALKDKTKDSTAFIVAQRISTIMHAEQILVLDEGRLVGKGTHRELLANCEVYKQIASSQLSQKELEESSSVGKEEN